MIGQKTAGQKDRLSKSPRVSIKDHPSPTRGAKMYTDSTPLNFRSQSVVNFRWNASLFHIESLENHSAVYHIKDMDKSFFAPIRIPPLSTALSIPVKLIFHFLGHVFWFSGIFVLIILGYHGAFPVIDNMMVDVISFQTILPPFAPVEVSAVTAEAVLGLLRLMVLSFGLAIVVLAAGAVTLLALSILRGVVFMPAQLVRWMRTPTKSVEPLPPPAEQREALDWDAAVNRAQSSQTDPPSLDWVRDAGAWTGKALKKAQVLGKRAIARAQAALNRSFRREEIDAEPDRDKPPQPASAWSQIRDAFDGPKPPVVTHSSAGAKRRQAS